MSHLTAGLHLCGKNQYATMPGSAVVLARNVDILARLLGIVIILELASDEKGNATESLLWRGISVPIQLIRGFSGIGCTQR